MCNVQLSADHPLVLQHDICITIYEPEHDKTNNMTRAPSDDSSQPGDPPSLISHRCLHEKNVGFLSTQKAHSKD